MTTARDFCELALTEAGVLGVGQSALPQDINNCFTLMSRMIAQFQKKRWLVPSLYEVSAVGNDAKSNLIGPGQYYNAARPDKIQAAYFLQLNNSNASNPVSFLLRPIFSYEDYALVALKQLNSWPMYFFYDGAFPYGNVFIWPIPSDQYEIHLIIKSPIGFTIQLEDGVITNAGAGYVDAVYPAVAFTSLTGYGSGGTADITVAGGIVTNVAVSDASGDGYVIGDLLSIDNASLGGSGAGFVFKVTEVTDSLDAEFNMPPEYEEAIHYNLCIRLRTMYQYPADPAQGSLARAALNTLRMANAQVPTLRMPASLQNVRSNNFYIFNADAQ